MEFYSRPLNRYLHAFSPRGGQAELEAPSAGFVTASRQPGAGGRGFCEAFVRLMEKSGDPDWQVFDSAAFRRAVHEARLEAPARLADEEVYEGVWADLWEQVMGAPAQSAVMWHAFKAMRRLARAGRIVFLGRGAVRATRDLGGVHVRLVAGEASRLARVAKRYALSPLAARGRMREIEKSRRRFFWGHFQRDIDDPALYDLVLNTDEMSMEEAALLTQALLVERLRERAGLAAP